MVLRILIYYILTFFFTILLGGVQQETGLLPELILPQLAPGIAAILMLLFFRKDKHSIKFEFKSNQVKKYLLSIGYPILITAIAIIAVILFTERLGWSQLTLIPSLVVIASTLIGSIGEEIGWRSYLQPTLNKKMNLFWSSILTAALWAPWHVGNFSYGITYAIGFILAIFGYTFFISYLIKDTKFNLVIAVLFHWFVNLANSVAPTNTLLSSEFMLTLGMVWIIAALILGISQKKVFKKKA